MAFKDVLLNILKTSAEDIEKVAVETELQQIHDEDVAEWTAVCDGGLIFITKLAAKTKSSFVAALLQGLADAINESKQANP